MEQKAARALPPLYSLSPENAERIARVCHEANRVYCESMGDLSQQPWEQAPDWQKLSSRNGVLGVLCNGDTPEASHERWMEQKVSTGWKFGEKKDPDKLEHPCLVPYAELPEQQQRKDHLFNRICYSMAEALQLTIVNVDQLHDRKG